jgi:hypothetical protein
MTRLIFAIAFGILVSGLPSASAQPRPLRPRTPKIKPKIKRVIKLPTTLRVGTVNWGRGSDVDIFATLHSSIGRPLVRANIRFEIIDVHTSAVEDSCTGVTNGYGRGHCLVSMPFMNAAASYEIRARYAGNSSAQPAQGKGTIWNRTPVHQGRLGAPGSPRISLDEVKGATGERATFRARLTLSGKPYAKGKVHFTANGRDLGSATPNAAGIAKLTITPRASQLRSLIHQANPPRSPPYWLGGFQAWWEPPAGEKSEPVAVVRPGKIFQGETLCEALQGPATSCHSSLVRARVFEVAQEAHVQARKNNSTLVRVLRKARIRFEVTEPPRPPRNSDCNPRAFDGAAAFCERPCDRLNYYDFDEFGFLGSLVGPSSGRARCGWALEAEVTPSLPSQREMHDACALAAANQRRSTWNHSVRMTFPHRRAGVFQFRDPHTVGSGGNWEAQSTVALFIRMATVNVPVRVDCR